MLTEIYCNVDDFYKKKEFLNKNAMLTHKKKSNRGRKSAMTKSEIMTIVIFYHHSKFKNFKSYYEGMVKTHLTRCFRNLVSYNRFVELMQSTILDLFMFLHNNMGKCTGTSFIDSFSYSVCHIKRASSNKVFKGIAKKGKTSVGWFFGFKVHVTTNGHGEIIDFCLTPGNVSDSNREVITRITKKLFGKLFGDRGYISSKIFKELYSKGVFLVTKIRKNMKNKLMELEDKFLLKKRGVIESVFSKLKIDLDVEHSRHRSVPGFLANLLGGLCAYVFEKKKPSIYRHKCPKLKAS